MRRFKWKLLLAFVGVALISLGALSSDAFAVNEDGDTEGAKSNDKKIGKREGVKESLAGPSEETGDGPTKLQMWIGVGSIPVMIIVVKYL